MNFYDSILTTLIHDKYLKGRDNRGIREQLLPEVDLILWFPDNETESKHYKNMPHPIPDMHYPNRFTRR